MLLDFQMPRLNGIQVVEAVRKYVQQRNADACLLALKIQIVEPRFVFLTAFLTKAFRLHIAKLEITEAFEKPLQTKTLREILGIPIETKKFCESSDEEFV
jgi:CheY-like chemotaxis protein